MHGREAPDGAAADLADGALEAQRGLAEWNRERDRQARRKVEDKDQAGRKVEEEDEEQECQEHERGRKDIEEAEEGREPKAMATPIGPTKKEREQHELTHVPFRSWCEHCVRGRGRRKVHRRAKKKDKDEELENVTKVYIDFYYNGLREDGGAIADDEEAEIKGDSPGIVLYDDKTKAVASWIMSSKSVTKGGPNDWVPKAISEEISQWGYRNRKVILVSDGEAAVLRLKERITDERDAETVPEESPVGEHQANLAENAVRRVRDQTRSILSQLESDVGGKLKKDADAVQWAVRWAGMLISCYQVGEDGKTPYERIRGRRCKVPIAKFGERVLYKELEDGKADRAKIESAWKSGIWLGIKGRTREHIIGTDQGVIKAFTVRRRPEEEKWSLEEVSSVRGTPGNPRPGRMTMRIPVRVGDQNEPIIDKNYDRSKPRRVYLRKRDFQKHGYTAGCEGCAKLSEGRDRPGWRRPHSEDCVARMLEEMGEDEEGQRRIQDATDRGAREADAIMMESDGEDQDDIEEKRMIEDLFINTSDDEDLEDKREEESSMIMDLSVRWDLSKDGDRKKVMSTIRDSKPKLVVSRSTTNLGFLMEVFRAQSEMGGYFVHEALTTSTTWRLPVIRRVRTQTGVSTAVVSLQRGSRQTRFMSNSFQVIEEMKRKFNEHRNQEKPSTSHRALAEGIRKQSEVDTLRVCRVKVLSTVNHEDIKAPEHEEDSDQAAWDDMSGVPLDPKLVKAARQEEIEYVKKRNVYTKVKRSEVPSGAKVIRVKWVDVNKGDANNLDIRSRLVAMDFKDGDRPELFAGTPPTEALRILCSMAATRDDDQEEEKVIMVNDVRRAYFYAEVTRPVWVELPEEDYTDDDRWEDRVAKLNVSMYGTRDAAMNWDTR